MGMRGALTRHKWLVAYGVSPEVWARRYGIEPYTAPCGNCGRILTTSIPFSCEDVRGLKCPRCECGNELTPYCVVAAKGDLLDGC